MKLKVSKFVREQYKNDSKLQDRIQIYRYTERKEKWYNWVFYHLKLNENTNILELGSGTANLWKLNFNELPDKLNITLSDVSKGMLKGAKLSLKGFERSFNFMVINIESISLEDNSFDTVIANHMLYHTNNRDQALSEVKRVLKSKGNFYVTTISNKHQQELKQMLVNFDKRLQIFDNLENNFRYENGKDILGRYFKLVNIYDYQNNLKLSEADPIFRYALSCFNGEKWEFLKQNEQNFLSYCNDLISQNGFIEITNKNGLFECFD